MSLEPQERFAFDMDSAIRDVINNHTGILRDLVTRLDPNLTDEVYGNVRELLLRQVEELQNKKKRAREKVYEFVGGYDAWIQLYDRWMKEDT